MSNLDIKSSTFHTGSDDLLRLALGVFGTVYSQLIPFPGKRKFSSKFRFPGGSEARDFSPESDSTWAGCTTCGTDTAERAPCGACFGWLKQM